MRDVLGCHVFSVLSFIFVRGLNVGDLSDAQRDRFFRTVTRSLCLVSPHFDVWILDAIKDDEYIIFCCR